LRTVYTSAFFRSAPAREEELEEIPPSSLQHSVERRIALDIEPVPAPEQKRRE
jgi:hypothetical protein